MILSTAPDVWWSMDEASGTRVDSTGNGYDLVEFGGTAGSGVGRVGNALFFDGADLGANRYLKLAGSTFPDHAADFTWCGWVKSTSTTPSVLRTLLITTRRAEPGVGEWLTISVGHGLDANGSGVWSFGVSHHDGLVGVAHATLNYGGFSPTEWTFWAVTYKHSTQRMELYLNGGLRAFTTSPFAIAPALDWSGGVTPTYDNVAESAYFDEYARYPAVLTLADIQWLYNSGNGQAYYQLVP